MEENDREPSRARMKTRYRRIGQGYYTDYYMVTQEGTVVITKDPISDDLSARLIVPRS